MNAKGYFTRKWETSKMRILRKVLLTVVSLFIICSILSRILFAYIEYKSHDTQITVYQLDEAGKRK